MKKLIVLTVALMALLIFTTGCGISQSDYDKVIAENSQLHNQMAAMSPTPKHFENRTAIENWLKAVPKLGVSKDVETWFQYALYYQHQALKSGYYLSVSYAIQTGGVSITCDIFTVDGYLFYFNPDDCVLNDTNIRIDMVDDATLETNNLHGTY